MRSKKRGKIIKICALVLGFLLIAVPVAAVIVYESYCGKRFYTDEATAFSLSDFPDLRAQRYEFPSDDGQTLVGYRYFHESMTPDAVVVIAHGFGGGGHNSYMDVADFFASNGFAVFAFDATGNDESGGKGVCGLPQGVIDLDTAISFVEGCEDFRGLPIVLFGHSWGGYSVCSVLKYHPEVRAVVSLSGFNRSSDLLEAQGEELVGAAAKIIKPYVLLWERVKFGPHASDTAMDGFKCSDARVMIVHSGDDDTVPIECGYDIYRREYGDSERFRFIRFEDKGHNGVYQSDEHFAYVEELNKAFAEYKDEVGYADMSKSEKSAARLEWLRKNLDREKHSHSLNADLFAQFVSFYSDAVREA